MFDGFLVSSTRRSQLTFAGEVSSQEINSKSSTTNMASATATASKQEAKTETKAPSNESFSIVKTIKGNLYSSLEIDKSVTIAGVIRSISTKIGKVLDRAGNPKEY